MIQAPKVSTALLLLITFAANAQSQTLVAPNSHLAAPQIQDNSSSVPLEPVGSFPPEPVLEHVTSSVGQVLERADNLRNKGDYPAALRIREEGLELARHSTPVDEGFALRGKVLDLANAETHHQPADSTDSRHF